LHHWTRCMFAERNREFAGDWTRRMFVERNREFAGDWTRRMFVEVRAFPKF